MDTINASKVIRIADAGFNEHWLRDRIYDDPSLLGLGELQALTKEKTQSSGGRIDLLLKNPEDDSMYEVELQLGRTDETHIIRTLEYWDNEKRRWPKRSHTAVLVAEEITSRFFNVVQLLSHSIPIIGIQANLIEVGNQRALHFVKIIDTYQEPEVEEESETFTEQGWREYSPHTVDIAHWYRDLLSAHYDNVIVKYLTNDLVLRFADYVRVWIHPRKNNRVFLRVSTENQLQAIDELEKRKVDCRSIKDWGIGFNVDLQQLKTDREAHEWLATQIAMSYLKTK